MGLKKLKNNKNDWKYCFLNNLNSNLQQKRHSLEVQLKDGARK